MPGPRAYLDHNATTPLHPAAREAMCAALDHCGNPSSVHAEGRKARAMVEAAREEIAAFFHADARSLIFTSGGTEALNLVLTPRLETAAESGPFDVLLAGAGEHSAVLAGHRFPAGAVETIGLTRRGVLDLEALETALGRRRGSRVMLALQAANNETGAIQPVAAAAKLVHASGGFVVCDAVQGAGKIDCDLETLGADALVFSAHKFGGPKGVGGVCLADGAAHIRDPLHRGGGQERGARAGTENVAAIAGTAAALRAVKDRLGGTGGLELSRRDMEGLRDRLEADVRRIRDDAVFFGDQTERLPNTSCFAAPGVEAQVLLMFLDIEGVAVSAGSACSSGKVKRSHVLTAMGVGENLVQGAIRVSLGWNSRAEDCDSFSRAFAKAARTMSARKVQTASEAAA